MELYVHIPFCVRKCTYCDFLSFPADQDTVRAYVETMLKEIRRAPETHGEELSSIYIGGGTPTLLEGEQLSEILETIRGCARLEPDAEISIEANPGTVTREKLASLKKAGFNRLSLGLQSPRERELALLGRIHNTEEFLESFQLARDAGFDSINVDLMSCLPGQSCRDWEENLRFTAALGPEHISAYGLMLEEGTPLARSRPVLPDEESQVRMYQDTAVILEESGYRQYEISNYAIPGFECRHNTGYWERTDYLGVGLGAASLIHEKGFSGSDGCPGERDAGCGNARRFSNTRRLSDYLAWDGETRELHMEPVRLSREDEMEEYWFLGLRMLRGVSLARFEASFGISAWEVYGTVLERHLSQGLLEQEGDRIRLTRRALPVCNYVMSDFILTDP